ncbi:MAG TPA: YIP1 family protein [Longimicrobiaceae bacterium]|nr:YIP1 family protein [Longimicrobiaceae bacterium]
MDTVTAPPAAPGPPETSPSTPLWEDFLDIFYAPTKVFERRRGARFGLLLVIVTILVGVLFVAMQQALAPAFAAEMQRGMEAAARNGRAMSAEQMASAQKIGTIVAAVVAFISVPVGVVVLGLILWAVAKAFGSTASVGAAMLIATYGEFPKILGELAGVVEGLVSSPATVWSASFSAARFMDPDTPRALLAAAAHVDVFAIWSAVLLGIGIHVIGRIPKAQACVTAIIMWVVAALPTVLGAAMSRG